jgi:hypothetical protein
MPVLRVSCPGLFRVTGSACTQKLDRARPAGGGAAASSHDRIDLAWRVHPMQAWQHSGCGSWCAARSDLDSARPEIAGPAAISDLDPTRRSRAGPPQNTHGIGLGVCERQKQLRQSAAAASLTGTARRRRAGPPAGAGRDGIRFLAREPGPDDFKFG